MILVEWEGKAFGTNRRLETNRYGTVYKNRGYKGFQEGLIWMLKAYRREKTPLEGHVKVRMHFTISELRDIDSLMKPVLDCIEKAGVIDNDRQIRVLLATKTPKKRRRELDRIRVAVEKLQEKYEEAI